MTFQKKQWLKWTAAALIIGAAAIFVWQRYFVKRDEGLASGNGRIEAPEIDVGNPKKKPPKRPGLNARPSLASQENVGPGPPDWSLKAR